jgi:hypothetical protein
MLSHDIEQSKIRSQEVGDCEPDGVAVRGQTSPRSLSGSVRILLDSSYKHIFITVHAAQLCSQLEGCPRPDQMQVASTVAWLIGTSRRAQREPTGDRHTGISQNNMLSRTALPELRDSLVQVDHTVVIDGVVIFPGMVKSAVARMLILPPLLLV